MAATKRNAAWIEATRDKIQTSQLLNRLQNHVHGKCEMSPTQVAAAKILLGKSLPDLQAISLGVNVGLNVKFLLQNGPQMLDINQGSPLQIEGMTNGDLTNE